MPVSMRAEYLNPFMRAICEVLEEVAGAPPEKGPLGLAEAHFTTEEITVLLGVVGSVRGVILYGFDEQAAKGIASAMLGERVPIFDRLAESAIGEFGNLITGRAAGYLEEGGLRCDITPPLLIMGRGTIISSTAFRRLIVPLRVKGGELQVSLALSESGERGIELVVGL